MSTASSALRSYDPVAAPEPVLRRRRSARAARNFTLVRGGRRTAAPRPDRRVAALETEARRSVAAPETAVRRSVAAPVPPRAVPTRALVRPAPRVRRETVPVPGDIVARAIAFAPVESVGAGRRTRPFDLTDAELDLAFATVPRTAPVRRPRRTEVADRGPGHRAPRGALAASGPVRGVGPARGAHPLHRVEQAQRGLAALALTALATALIVVTFLGLAHLRAGGFGDRTEAPVPGVAELFSTGGLPEPVR